ncbi:MAG: anti-sigma factor family protein [Candidatus Aminicenantales bacterium]
MTCERFEELLSAYLEGDLSPEEKREMDAHLASCLACAELLTVFQETQEALRGFPEVEPGPTLMARLYAIPEKKSFFQPAFDFLVRPSLQPVFAALSALFIAISFVFFLPQGRGIQKAIDRQLHLGYNQVEKIYAKAGSLTDELGSLKNSFVDSIKTLTPEKGQEDKK